jgi:excisionase family DNA binding protein
MTEETNTRQMQLIANKMEKAVLLALGKLEKPMTQTEAADFLSIKLVTIQTKICRGEIPHHRAPGGSVYLYASELNAFIKGETK